MVCGGIAINDMPKGWTNKGGLNTRIYNCWYAMINRCYSDKHRNSNPTYEDCYVCDRWLALSNFVEDIVKIDGYEYWLNHPNERVALDKDIKSNGVNKCYCLEQCMFVTIQENTRQATNTREGMSTDNENRSISLPVFQYDKNGVFIKKFKNVIDAERELNIDHSNIVKCCRGKRKSAGGFIWKYEK